MKYKRDQSEELGNDTEESHNRANHGLYNNMSVTKLHPSNAMS